MYGNLFYVNPISYQINNIQIEPNDNKKRKITSNDSYLWHLRLGHINPNRIQRLIHDGPLGTLRLEEWPQCESCLMGKMTKRPFTQKKNRAKEILALVHTDVCGPMTIPARGGYEYFITFTDDHTRFGCVYLMRRKSDSFDKFKEFKAEVERQTGKLIKTLRSDRDGEYLLGEFKDYLVHYGIVSQLTALGSPQQNGVAERRNRTLMEMVRSMMCHATLPVSFWGYALETAAYILNLVPSKSVPRTPYEMWTRQKPSLNHLKIWGCPAYVLTKGSKLEPRSELCYFVGYPKGTRGGYFYHSKEHKVFVSTHAKYLDHEQSMSTKGSSRVELEEKLSFDSTSDVRIEEPEETQPNVPIQTDPCCSGRITRVPERWTGEVFDLVSDHQEQGYEEAIVDADATKWQVAMNVEIESMYLNQVWDLVTTPEGIKPIGCKWVYKRKRDVSGKVETYKARLVAKGYTQK